MKTYIELSAYGFKTLPDGSTEPADNGDGEPPTPDGWCVYATSRDWKTHEIVGDLFEGDYPTEDKAMDKAEELSKLYNCEINYY